MASGVDANNHPKFLFVLTVGLIQLLTPPGKWWDAFSAEDMPILESFDDSLDDAAPSNYR